MFAALIPALLPILSKVLGAVLPDPEAQAKAMSDILAGLQQSDLAQMDINKAEAQSPSIFKGGWRPAIGWICALALGYQYMLVPLFVWGTTWAGTIWTIPALQTMPSPPTLDDNLWQLMFGMLGMGALRSFEKLKGVASR